MRTFKKSSPKRIALLLTPVNLRRFTPGLVPFVSSNFDFLQIDPHRSITEILGILKNSKVDGLVTEYLPGINEHLMKLNIPTIVCPNDYNDVGAKSLTYIDVNDIKVGEMAAEHFHNLGFKNFAFLGNDSFYSRRRENGYTHFLKQKSIVPNTFKVKFKKTVQYTEYWIEEDKGFIQWIKDLPRPCAILVAHDPLGRHLAQNCLQNEIEVPEEISILGVNNDDLVSSLANPPLSSIMIPWDKIGFEIGRNMEKLLAGQKLAGQTILIDPTNIITRRSSDVTAVSDPIIPKALAFIRDNITTGINVSDVVEHVHVNRRTLEKSFRTHLNRSPREEIVRIRINTAKELLTTTDLAMPEIAERSGFSNAERLSIVFKQVAGVPPMTYRNKQRWQ